MNWVVVPVLLAQFSIVSFKTESELQHRSGAMLLNKTSTKSCRVVSCSRVIRVPVRNVFGIESFELLHLAADFAFIKASSQINQSGSRQRWPFERVRNRWEVCQSDWYKMLIHKEQTGNPDWVVDFMCCHSLPDITKTYKNLEHVQVHTSCWPTYCGLHRECSVNPESGWMFLGWKDTWHSAAPDGTSPRRVASGAERSWDNYKHWAYADYSEQMIEPYCSWMLSDWTSFRCLVLALCFTAISKGKDSPNMWQSRSGSQDLSDFRHQIWEKMRVCAVRVAVRVGSKTGFEESAGPWAADSLGWEWDESILPRKRLRVASVGLVAVLVPLLLRQTYLAIPKLTATCCDT